MLPSQSSVQEPLLDFFLLKDDDEEGEVILARYVTRSCGKTFACFFAFVLKEPCVISWWQLIISSLKKRIWNLRYMSESNAEVFGSDQA